MGEYNKIQIDIEEIDNGWLMRFYPNGKIRNLDSQCAFHSIEDTAAYLHLWVKLRISNRFDPEEEVKSDG